MAPKPSPIRLDMFDDQRRQRALALANLAMRAARESSYVVDKQVSDELTSGLLYLEDEVTEELALLLGLKTPEPPAT